MRGNKILQLIVIFVLASANIASCHAIDLKEAIDKAIKNSSKIKSQFYQYKSVEKRLKSHRLSWFLPDIDLQYYCKGDFDFNQNQQNSGKRLILSQKVIDSGATFTTFGRSSYLLKEAKARFQELKQEVAFSAVKAYVDVLKKTEILKLREHKERVSLEHLLSMEKRFSLGEVTNAEVLSAKAKFSSSVSKRVDANGKLKLASITYYHLIGEDADNLSDYSDKLPSIPDLNECLKLAKINNLSLKGATYRRRAAEIEVVSETLKWLPSLNLRASKDFGEEDIEYSRLLKDINVVFTLDIPLFKRGINTFSIDRAKMDTKQLTFAYYETVKITEQDVIDAWNNILTAKSFIKAGQEAERAAALALEEIKKEVELNLKSATDLLDTEDELFKARSELIQAKGSYVISVYNLLFIMNSVNL